MFGRCAGRPLRIRRCLPRWSEIPSALRGKADELARIVRYPPKSSHYSSSADWAANSQEQAFFDLPQIAPRSGWGKTACPMTSEELTMKRELILNGNPMEEVVGFARAVRVGPYITIGGTAPVDSEGKTVGIGDAGRQAERIFEIIGDALERAGSGWLDVVRTRIILTNIDDWKSVIDVRARFCREPKPVDTIMQVARFVNPEWLVEVEADAVVADE